MTRRSVPAGALLGLLLAGCAAPEPALHAARRELLRGELVEALALLDEVAPADADYPEARSTAQAVARRLSVGQRLFARGLELRAQWRDEEAIEAFRAAQLVWPDLPGGERLIVATERRSRVLESRAVEPTAVMEVATTVPVTATVAPASPPGGGVVEPAPDRAGVGPAALLTEVRELLRAGDVDAALDRLEGVRDTVQREPAVAGLLVEVLHQRALLHYGAGELTTAVAVWRRLLLVDPDHVLGRAFFQAAMIEIETRDSQG